MADDLTLEFDPLHTLGFLGTDWVEAHCRVPGGVYEGEALTFNGWQLYCTVNHYRILPDAVYDPRRLLAPFRYRRSIVVGPQKALALDTPIATPDGWTTMGDVAVGDTVFDEAGHPTRVTAKSQVWESDTYRVTFSDGAELVACGDHQWWVDVRTPSAKYVRARVRTADMYGNLEDKHGARRFRVPNAEPLVLPPADLPIDPYTLGAWLGDGDSDSGAITTPDEGVFDRIASAGYEIRANAKLYRSSIVGLTSELRAAGLIGRKHIPEAYLRASESQRWALLQGLMDTDGHTDRRGKCEFVTVLPELRDGMMELLATLGMKPIFYEGEAKLYGRVTGPKFRVYFSTRSDMPVYTLERKQARLKPPGRSHAQFGHRRIVSVEKIDAVPTQCLTVEAESHVFLAGREMIPTCNSGKSPWGAGMLLLEAVGPSLFAGWAAGGEAYRCEDHGCSCGWEYHYQPGEAMGMPRRKSLLGIVAFAEAQTANVYEPLQTMIHSGPLAQFVFVREGFIRLPNRGKIVPLSSAAKSKLGQPLTGALGDESGLYTVSNRMLDTWQTMRRGVAGMQGRTIELTNPWDPMENSAAQQAFQSRAQDIFRYYRKPPAELDYKRKVDRRKVHQIVYSDSPWVDPATAIDPEADELVETDPTQAERFFGNRLVQGLGSFMPEKLWTDTEDLSQAVHDGAEIAIGFDGSRSMDWSALRAETRDGHRFTPTYGPDSRPTFWNPDEWGGRIPRGEVDAAFRELMSRYRVRRAYIDPRHWETQADTWAADFGEDVVVLWPTFQINRMFDALTRFSEDTAEGLTTHDDCETTRTHALNARKVAKPGDKYILGKPSDHQKIDLLMADVLAHEAAADARAEGWEDVDSRMFVFGF